MTNENLYTNQNDSKLLAETGLMKGVEPDGLLYGKTKTEFYPILKVRNGYNCTDYSMTYWNLCPAIVTKVYRLDKLLMRLPDRCFEKNYNWCEELRHNHAFDLAHEAFALFQSLLYLRGQQAIQATVKLLVLLSENGLLDEEIKL